MIPDILISDKILDVTSIIDAVKADNAGGIDIFIGTVRNNTQGRRVTHLDFESYESMALLEIQKIINHIYNTYAVKKVIIHHRVGMLTVGEIPVVIAVSAAHRAAAFDACRYAIDTLKQRVPIWKKEYFEDGSVWVTPNP